MKISALLSFSLLLTVPTSSFAEDLFVYSEDGITATGGERMLPVQACDKVTGKIVFHLADKTDAQRADCGWYRVIPHAPVASNYVFSVTGHVFYVEGEAKGTCDQLGTVTRKPYYVTYHYYSKWKIYGYLAQRGKWDIIETWLTDTTIQGINLKKAWDMCQVVSDDSDLFVAVKAQAQEILGFTDSEMQALMDYSLDYTKRKREDINK